LVARRERYASGPSGHNGDFQQPGGVATKVTAVRSPHTKQKKNRVLLRKTADCLSETHHEGKLTGGKPTGRKTREDAD